MSDYATPFADKLLDDKSFDTIFGGLEDDDLMTAVMREAEDPFINDEVDTDGVEDGIGAIGKGTGLGSDLGPNHDTKGGMKPTDDSSDQEFIGKEELPKHVIDASKADPTQKAAGDICDRCIEDESDKLKKTNSFEDAYSNLLKELAEEDYGEDISGSPAPAGDVPAAAEAPAEPENMTDALDSDDEDDDLIASLVGEEAEVATETRDNNSVNDTKEDNLGDDLGPDHDTTGGMKPSDDSSDEDIIAAVAGEHLKDGQLNIGDNAYGKIEDGDTVDPADARVAGDTTDAADDSFDEAEDIMNAVAGKQPEEKPEQKPEVQKNEQCKEAALEDGSTTESEEDALLKAAEDTDAPMKFNVDELNEDEDDEIMASVMGGKTN